MNTPAQESAAIAAFTAHMEEKSWVLDGVATVNAVGQQVYTGVQVWPVVDGQYIATEHLYIAEAIHQGRVSEKLAARLPR